MNNTLSIIIPVYNAEKYIGKCIDSIINQDIEDYEVLLIDDGSSDKSGEICEDYAAKFPRIKVYHQQNAGVSAARNQGIKRSTGKYITFVDADDALAPDALTQLLTAVRHHRCRCAIFGLTMVSSDGRQSSPYMGEDKTTLMTIPQIVKETFIPTYFYLGYCWSKIYEKEIIIGNQIWFDPNIFYNEDRLFFLSYLLALDSKERVYLTTHPIYYYLQNDQSAIGLSRTGFHERELTELDAYHIMIDKVSGEMNSVRLLAAGRFSMMRAVSMLRAKLHKMKLNRADVWQKLFKHTWYAFSLADLFHSPRLGIYTLGMGAKNIFMITFHLGFSLFRK